MARSDGFKFKPEFHWHSSTGTGTEDLRVVSSPQVSTGQAGCCISRDYAHSSTLMRKLLPVGCIRYSLRMGFKTLSFFCPVLGGPGLGEAGSAPLRRADRCAVSCRRRSGSSVSPVGSPLESGVSPAHIGPSNACHRAAPETTRYGDQALRVSPRP